MKNEPLRNQVEQVEDATKVVVVVLGVHRGGTSALTRGLRVLGLQLGDRLMPPAANNNPTGFWEDIDVVELDEAVLASSSRDWYSLRPTKVERLTEEESRAYVQRGSQILRAKMRNCDAIAFKDPRVAKLIPLWTRIFEVCGLRPRYVLSSRHPGSVAASLHNRDGLDMELGYLIWADHALASLQGTRGAQRVLVDFDRMMQDPGRELQRIGRALDLPMLASELRQFREEFLDERLRHTHFEESALTSDPACPPLVREMFRELSLAAQDLIDINAAPFMARVDQWAADFARMRTALDLLDRQYMRLIAAHQDRAGAQSATQDAGGAPDGGQVGPPAHWQRRLEVEGQRAVKDMATLRQSLVAARTELHSARASLEEERLHARQEVAALETTLEQVRADAQIAAADLQERLAASEAELAASRKRSDTMGLWVASLAQAILEQNDRLEHPCEVDDDRRERGGSTGVPGQHGGAGPVETQADIEALRQAAEGAISRVLRWRDVQRKSAQEDAAMRLRLEALAQQRMEENDRLARALAGAKEAADAARADAAARQLELLRVHARLSQLTAPGRALRRLLGGVTHPRRYLQLARDQRRIRRSGRFDADYYLSSCADVRVNLQDALAHYCESGWREGRNPCVDFDTQAYLRQHPECLRGGENPFAHFLRTQTPPARSVRHRLNYVFVARNDATSSSAPGGVDGARGTPLELTAAHDLQRVPDEPGAWEAVDEDPFFHLRAASRMPRRWVRILIAMRSADRLAMFACIYVDAGEGYSEATKILLPEPDAGWIDIVALLPPHVAALRFDPMVRIGEFHLDEFKIRELSKVEVGARLLARYMRRHVHGWKDLPGMARRVYTVLANGGLKQLKNRLVEVETRRPQARIQASLAYGTWLSKYFHLSSKERSLIVERANALLPGPCISIIMPVYNTDPRWLRAAIESVRAQVYPNWQLCLSDDASTLPGVRELLQDFVSMDKRIELHLRSENGHISRNSNDALKLARGEFVALMDADDEIPEDALFWVAEEIRAHPNVDLIYSDEDKIDAHGRRFDPYFKSDWNPALILSQNFYCHLGVYRRDLVERVGGFRAGFEGSQDHDLLLRCIDEPGCRLIRHVPRILYHWRAISGSTASSDGGLAKPYAWQSGARAIAEHLQRCHIRASVVPAAIAHGYQVNYEMAPQSPLVSIVMPSACRLELVRPCLAALLERTTYPNFEVLVVVNEIRFADPQQAAYLNEMKSMNRVRLLVYPDCEFNFSWINNWAARQARGSIFCLMNDDVEVTTPDWLEKFVARLALDRVGAVGAMLYFPDNTIQHAGVTLGLGGVAGHTFSSLPRGTPGYFSRAIHEQDLSCVTAACMAIRREAFEQAGGFDEELAVAFNDVDLCLRIRRDGWRIIWTPQVEHFHHESATLGKHNSPERIEKFRIEVERMRSMWGPILDADPFYNPNLSLRSHQMDLAMPPRISKLPEALAENR